MRVTQNKTRIDKAMPRYPIIRAACVKLRARMTAQEIADELGITRNAVIGHWHRAREDAKQREAAQ